MFPRYKLFLQLTNLKLFVTSSCFAFQIPKSRSGTLRSSQSYLGVSLDQPRRTYMKDLMEENNTADKEGPMDRPLIIHWRGEKESGYSKPFRQLEFVSALEAELGLCYTKDPPLSLNFINALQYAGIAEMADVNIEHFNEAMQYVEFPSDDDDNDGNDIFGITREAVIRAGERCSLVHAIYEVIASSEDINELASLALEDGGFQDLYKGGKHERMTWCFRARNYHDPTMTMTTKMTSSDTVGREKRYSSRARSMGLEKAGLVALTDLLIQFGGKVDLEEPYCKIYLFDGLTRNSKTLTRRIVTGPRTSTIAPATRICVTNTPLCPIASFSLCNVARITSTSKILDPYAGSCATLLAAAMIAPNCQTVGIDIASNQYVNRDDIGKDFTTRGLNLPRALLQGDSADPEIRQKAKESVGGVDVVFDAIVADPPYGIRESTGYNEKSPMEELFTAIANDREEGHRLLKPGGRLVTFVPVTDEQSLEEMLPSQELTEESGLVFEVSREQPLNDKLSRWLVSFVCVR